MVSSQEAIPGKQLEMPPIPAKHLDTLCARLHHSMGNHFLLAYVALKKQDLWLAPLGAVSVLAEISQEGLELAVAAY